MQLRARTLVARPLRVCWRRRQRRRSGIALAAALALQPLAKARAALLHAFDTVSAAALMADASRARLSSWQWAAQSTARAVTELEAACILCKASLPFGLEAQNGCGLCAQFRKACTVYDDGHVRSEQSQLSNRVSCAASACKEHARRTWQPTLVAQGWRLRS